MMSIDLSLENFYIFIYLRMTHCYSDITAYKNLYVIIYIIIVQHSSICVIAILLLFIIV